MPNEKRKKLEELRKEARKASKTRAQLVANKYSFVDCCAAVGDGWADLLDGVFSAMQEILDNGGVESIQVLQIKEKFGGLRIYTELKGGLEGRGKIYDIVAAAEEASTTTCEYCGEFGSLDKTKNWLKTLCPEHTESRGK